MKRKSDQASFAPLYARHRLLHAVWFGAALVSQWGCSEAIVEKKTALGGSCLGCHSGITDMHPDFALSCVDCHGGNDNITLPANLNIRDQAVMKQSHVLPRDPEMWWPNGIDDTGEGLVDEPGEFFDGRVIDEDGNGAQAEGRIAARAQHDSEINKDLNYLRFLNPGDLRVAQATCGAKSTQANAAMVCHAEIVYDARRSIMSLHDAVPTGAAYANAQLPLARQYGEAFASSEAGQRFDTRNPRIGRYGYTFDYDRADDAFEAKGNAFDADKLLDANDNNLDEEDETFEMRAGPVFDDGSDPFDAKDGPGFTRTGQPLKFFDNNDTSNNRAVEVVQYIGGQKNRVFPDPVTQRGLELRVQKVLEGLGIARQSPIQHLFFDAKGQAVVETGDITNPVDAALRVFRAYHSLNFWGTNDNFGFVDFTTSPNADDPRAKDPSDEELRNNNNPFGRSRPTGCTSCHVPYAKNGHNEEPVDRTVADNGRQLSTDLPYGARIDRGERGYAKRHQLQTAVSSETCGSCHGFVTRVDYAMSGAFEFETDFTNLEKIATIGPIQYTTPPNADGQQSRVNIFDNLAHYKNGRIVNEGEGVSEDLNNNGELDDGEDVNNNGFLDIPDRVARSESFDGRQSRIVYGGYNGAIRLQDIHAERGMGCTDCHYVWDVHGDSNMYTRNWDAVAIECDDCHGTPYAEATLTTSGPNGGDRMDDPKFNTPFNKPWFEKVDGKLVQHSRGRADLQWVVPQLTSPKDALSQYAHNQPLESGPARPEEARAYAHIQETGKPGGLECYSCHSSWQPNCLSCHLKMDVTKSKQEIWFGDDDVEDVFFQLFSYTRSPFILARAGDVEGNKIAPYRSTMQVHVTLTAENAGGGQTLVDNAMFATQGNLSSMVSNPYFPHTVRTTETKSCARCHTLVDEQNNVANDHLISEATAVGTGRYNHLGDWAIVGTTGGMLQLDLKKEAKGKIQFPGFDFDATNARQVVFGNQASNDVAIVRGVAFENGTGDVADVVIVGNDAGLSFVDVTGRDNAGLPPTEIARVDTLGAVLSIDHVEAAASQSTRAIVLTNEELAVVDFRAALEFNRASAVIDADAGQEGDNGEVVDAGLDGLAQGAVLIKAGGESCALPNFDPDNNNEALVQGCTLAHGLDRPTRVRLHGRFALVTHARGLSVFALDEDPNRVASVDPGAPLAEIFTFRTARPALDVASLGRFAFVATGDGGVEVFDVGPVVYPLPDEPNPDAIAVALADDANQEPDSRGVAMFGSRLLVADGKNGLRILDVSTPALPVLERTIKSVGGGQPDINQATSVQPASVPTRNFAVIADGTNGVRAVNITEAVDFREKLEQAADPQLLNQTRGFRLSMERSDPLTPYDPKNAATQVFTYPVAGAATALARGFELDSLADPSGRVLRDAYSIGSTTLDDSTMARMRAVLVKEVPGTVDIRGDGLGCVVRAGHEADVTRDPENANRCLPPAP